MKKIFWIGFIIGILYVLVLAVVGRDEGLGMLVEILLIPGGFLIGGVLEYVFSLAGLRSVIANPITFWTLTAVTQGLFLGLVFVGIKRLFSKAKIYS